MRFGAYISAVTDAELLVDLLAAAATPARSALTNDASGIQAAVAGGTVAADGTISAAAAGGGLAIARTPTTLTAPATTVRYEGTTALMKNLPMARDLVRTAAGTAGGTAVTGPPAIAAFDPVAAVATGYAADANTGDDNTGAQDKVDENLNASSQVRIAVSSSVKARNP